MTTAQKYTQNLADIQTCTIDSVYPNLAIERYSEKKEKKGGGSKIWCLFFLTNIVQVKAYMKAHTARYSFVANDPLPVQ